MSDDRLVRAILTHDARVLVEQPDGSYRLSHGGTDWARVEAETDAEIEAAASSDPDAALLDESFWTTARVRHQGLHLDADVIEWFASQGPGWQTRMNAVLRTYVEAQTRRA